MEQTITDVDALPRQNQHDRKMLLACGLWLRAGLIGMGALAIGIFGLVDGTMGAASALALSIAGGALAFAGTQRARAVLDRAGKIADPSVAAVAADGIARGGADARAAQASPEHRTRAEAVQRFAGAQPKFSA